MSKNYYFYSRHDKSKEPIAYVKTKGRLEAAKYFAQVKQMSLKIFLTIFTISR